MSRRHSLSARQAQRRAARADARWFDKHGTPRPTSPYTDQAQPGNQMMQFDPVMGSPEAIKTYLNQEVALLRPQVAYSEIAHLYRLGVTARAAIDLRSEALRQVDFKLADPDGNLLEENTKLFTPKAMAVQAAFQNNFSSVIERSETSYCCYGEVLLRRIKSMNNTLMGFQWINNNFFRRETDPMHGMHGFHIRPVWGSDLDPDFDWIKPEDAVYLHNIDFFEDFGGTGALMVAYAQAATETEITATQLMFFRNMAMPSFVIQPAEGGGYVPGPDQKLELTEYLRRMYQGAANVGRTVVVPTRWEMLKFTQDFDKLGMPDLSDQARDAVLRIFRVPLELIEPRQSSARSTGTKFYDQKREWLISWLVPQSERYADIFTEQVAKSYDPEWRIIPTFKRVRGLDEDISSRTETVSKQLKDSVLDLATAQRTLGLQVDPHFEGDDPIYMIAGIPVPASQMRDYWKVAPGNPGMVTGGEPNKPDKPEKNKGKEKPGRKETMGSAAKPTKPTKSIDVAAELVTDSISDAEVDGTSSESEKSLVPVEQPQVIPFLKDEQHKELKNWRLIVERKGKDYPFAAKSLPAHAVAYGRLLLATDEPNEVLWSAIRLQAVKDYDATEAQYRTALYNMMTDAFHDSLNRKQFGIEGRDEITIAFLNAFKNGLQEAGVDGSEIDDEERAALELETKSERGYWTKLADDMYDNVIPLKETSAFAAARNAMLGRIEMWINKGLRRIKQMGQMYGKMNQMQRFDLGGTIDHCDTCSAANGQVHRARTWLRWNIYPRSDSCLCGGFKCDCSLTPTNEPARGSLAMVPTADGSKSDHGHDHNHTHAHIPDHDQEDRLNSYAHTHLAQPDVETEAMIV